MRAGVGFGFALALLTGCESGAGTPVTQVIVDIDAEASLRASIAELEIRVAGSDGMGDLDRRAERLMQNVRPGQEGEPDWPVRLALTPRGGDSERVFELSATALDSQKQFMVAARLITGYVEHETRYARLLIEASCLNKRCEALETCRGGVCADAWVDAASLLAYSGQREVLFGDEAGVPEDLPLAGGGGGGAGDTGMRDGGADGGVDAGGEPGSDAGTDAGGGPREPECEPDATRCEDDALRTCDEEGFWDEGTPCAYVCIDDACSGECVPDSKDCLEGVTPRHCDERAQWVEGGDCPAVCVDGECAASCEQGSAQCSGNDLLSCETDGTWSEPAPCEFLCDAETDACVGECVPDAMQCQEEELQSCGSDGEWGMVASCPFVCEQDPDDAAKFRCGGECVPTSTHCASITELEVCGASGDYGAPDTCDGQACGGTPAACRGTCSPGTRQCGDSSTLQVCGDDGEYDDTSCANQDQACIESGSDASCTGDCAPGTQQCSGNTVQECSDTGEWEDASNCTGSDETCQESGSTAVCDGDCAPGQTTCIDNDAYDCDAGDWSELDDCAAMTEICSAGACVANTPYKVGAATASGFSDFNPSNDFWYVIPIAVSTTADVQGMRMLVRAGVVGAFGRMALWEDNGGVPGAFMAQTGNIQLSAAGEVSAAPVPLATQVIGGRTYWIGAKFTGGAALYRNTGTTRDGHFYGQAFATNPSTSMDPFPIGSAGALTDVEYNFFLLVRDVSQ